LRVYDVREESMGTPLENVQHILQASDAKHYMQSGILRFLVLYKYGGIWADMDMVFLNDLQPILDQNFAYMWGNSKDFAKLRPDLPDCNGPCAAFMGAIKGDEHIEICIEELIQTQVRPGTTCYDEDMLGRVYRQKPFTVFPSAFFNTEWQINSKYPGQSIKVQEGWFDNPMTEDSSLLYLDAFSWHWHHSSNKDKKIIQGSKFHTFNRMMDNRLGAMGIIL